MALIPNPFTRALDDDGEPMPFAELFTKDPSAPSTGKTTYTDAGLTVPHTNPIVADDAGWFQEAFAAEGETFNLLLCAAGGDSAQPYQSASDVPAVGNDSTSTFSRTLPDARWKVSSGLVDGAATEGIIYEAGKLSPTNTGGYLLFQGWAGTQANLIEFNAASANFTANATVEGNLTVTGTVTVGGAGSSLIPIKTSGTSISAASTADIELDAGFSMWEIQIRNLSWSSNGSSIAATFSYDNGGSFKSSASEYLYDIFYYAAGVVATENSTGASSIKFCPTLLGTTPGGGLVTLRISSKPGSHTHMHSQYTHAYNSSVLRTGMGGGWVKASDTYGQATTLRLVVSAGTMTFDYVVIGIP